MLSICTLFINICSTSRGLTEDAGRALNQFRQIRSDEYRAAMHTVVRRSTPMPSGMACISFDRPISSRRCSPSQCRKRDYRAPEEYSWTHFLNCFRSPEREIQIELWSVTNLSATRSKFRRYGILVVMLTASSEAVPYTFQTNAKPLQPGTARLNAQSNQRLGPVERASASDPIRYGSRNMCLRIQNPAEGRIGPLRSRLLF